MPLRADPRGDGPRARAGRRARRAARRDPRARARHRRTASGCRRAPSASASASRANVLDRLAELGVLTPDRRGYDADDVRIIEAIARFREGGYDEALGFTVFDTLRYKDALAPLVEEEVRTLLDRLTGEVSAERAAEIISSGRGAAARADRRDALQAAARRARAPARRAGSRRGNPTPQDAGPRDGGSAAGPSPSSFVEATTASSTTQPTVRTATRRRSARSAAAWARRG